MGFIGDIFGGSDPQQTTALDPATQRFVERQLRPSAIAARRFALDPRQQFFLGPTRDFGRAQDIVRGAGGFQSRLNDFLSRARGGAAENFGLATAGFDPSSIDAFRTGFEENVIDPLRDEFEQQRGAASREARQRATQAGAFGGSRSRIAEELGQADLRRAEASTIGNIRQQAEEQALQSALGFETGRAGRAGEIGAQQFGQFLPGLQFGAGFDLQRAGTLAGLSEQERALRERMAQEGLFRRQQGLGFLRQGIGPFGQIQTQSAGSNPLGSAAGGAIAGGSQFGVPGAIIGGVGGLLGSIF